MSETTALAKKRSNPMADQVDRLIEAVKEEKSLTLPRDVDPERFWVVMKDQLRTNWAIRECSPESVYTACMKAAQYGLELGVRNIAHLVKYGNHAQLVIGYEGKIFLGVCRAKTVHAVNIVEIRKNDRFRQTEAGVRYEIQPFASTVERGPVIGYVVEVELATGKKQVTTISREEYEKRRPSHWDRQSQAGNYGPHVTHPEEMWKKSGIHKAFATVPLTPDVAALFSASDEAEREIAAEFEDVTPTPPARGVSATLARVRDRQGAQETATPPEGADEPVSPASEPEEPPVDPAASQGPSRGSATGRLPLGPDLDLHRVESEPLFKSCSYEPWHRWTQVRQQLVAGAMQAAGTDSPSQFWSFVSKFAGQLTEEQFAAAESMEDLLGGFVRACEAKAGRGE